MVSFVTDYIQNTAASYLRTGVTAAGTMAGNAVGGVGSLVENSGRSLGQGAQGVAGGVGSVGNYINSYGNGVRDKFAADGPVSAGGAAKKVAVKPGEGKTPGGAPRGVPSGGTKKALPAAAGAAKSLPAGGRPAGSPKPAAQGRAPPPKSAATGGAPKSAGIDAGKRTVSAASRPKMGAPGLKPPGAASAANGASRPPAPKPAANAPRSNAAGANGKVTISSASRPQMGAKGVKPAAR